MSSGSRNNNNGDGGLSITKEMKKILDRPGFISVKTGSEKLRAMFQTQFAKLDLNRLSPFAIACICGNYDGVNQAIENGLAPDLKTTQTPFQFGFVALTVIGARQLRTSVPVPIPLRHLDVLKLLISKGASPDTPDISGHTALHHAVTPPIGHAEMTKALLEQDANVNAQNRYGEVPLFMPFQGGDIELVDLLMEHGADLDIADGNGDTPRKMALVFGAQVTAAVHKWERKRKGEKAPLEEKKCENCGKKESGLKQCGRCHVVKYCSPECQRAHWKTHKPSCNPFSAANTITLKPNYTAGGVQATISRADFTREAFGLGTASNRPFRPGLSKDVTAENKSMVIKIQVPVDIGSNLPLSNSALASSVGLYIYNKKRDFVCTVRRDSNPEAYDAIANIVRTKGVGGAKAYFAAELKNKDELVVKTSEVLAEQPF